MKKSIYVCLLMCVGLLSTLEAQISELKYLMNYNCETSQYDVSIKIMEGSANTILDRIQFNSQLTILIPTGMSFEIVDRYQPLEDNQTYQGTVPNAWATYTPIISPDGHEKYDFYSVAPKLAPASFFNDIEEGEEICLFSFAVDGEEEFNERIRFFDNEIDNDLSLFEGADLRNGYSIGGAADKYNGNIHHNCVLSAVTQVSDQETNIYPNPTNSKINIDVKENTKHLKMMDSSGYIIKEIIDPSISTYTIDVTRLSAGTYYIQLDNGGTVNTRQFVVY